MPTAGRLTAAVFFAVLAWYVTDLAMTVMPSAYDRPSVPKWNALIAFCASWSVFRKLDGTIRHGLVLGLTAALLTTALITLCHSAALTFGAAWRGRTGSLLDTFESTFSTMGDIALFLLSSQETVIAAVVGALAIGIVSAMMQRRFT